MSDVVHEFHGAQLGDQRLNKRLLTLVQTIQTAPFKSLPALFCDPSQLEAAYRFISNPSVSPEGIMQPHHALTAQRAAQAGLVLVIHDSTSFALGGGARQGMGVVDPTDQPGFYLHTSICATLDGQPLGVLRTFAWSRTGKITGKISQSYSQYNPDRESLHWNEAVHDCDDAIHRAAQPDAPVRAVHVMDREADCIELLADMIAHNRSFVVRAQTNRRLRPGTKATDDKLFDSLATTPVHLKIQVVIQKHHIGRTKKAKNPENKGGRERKARVSWGEMRTAELEVRAGRRRVYSGSGGHAHVSSKGLEINVVQIREVDAPEGATPINWHLITDQAVESVDEIKQVIATYQRRWLIEELHKALKTGCDFEAHQFRHGDQYVKMLAIYMPIAMQMLRLRWFERFSAESEASLVLDEDQCQALQAYEASKGRKLPVGVKAKDVLRLIARLGGHQPHNGAPGWLVLGRGFAKLADLTEGWRAARAWFLAQHRNDGGSTEMC